MKTVEDYFKYLKEELEKIDSNISNNILDKVNKWEDFDNLTEISKMLFFLYKVEGVRIADYKEFQRI